MTVPLRHGSVPSSQAVTALLANGTRVEIRPLEPADHDAVADLHARASDDSIYMRFFTASRASAQTFVETICRPRPDTWSLVAVWHGRLVGVGTAIDAVDEATSEVALLVDESLHGVGIGTVLLEHLARRARARGVHTFTAEVLTSNVAMIRVFHDLGFGLAEQRDHDVVSLSLDLTLSREAVTASDTRQRAARRRSLRPLLEPASVAVVGVSRRRGRVGREVLENLRAGGYAGALFAVGRRGLRVQGATTVTRVAQLPLGVDLVVVAVPGARVQEAAARAAHTCVVLTSGMAEAGAAGVDVERRLVDLVHEHDMRMVGPNCFGVLSNLRQTRLDATFGCSRPEPGTLAIGSQSGGVGVALLDAARARGLGVSCFVSLGNKADVSGNDLLSAWHDDPDVRAGALYLESFHDPRTFARLAAAFSRRKPLLVVFGGSSAAGVRAGASHTAAHATPARALQALYRAAGVVDVDDLEDMVDTAALLTDQPLTAGPRLGVLGNAGGLGILAADAAQRRGLLVPELTPATRAALRAAVPSSAGVANPVDLGAAAGADGFAAAARHLIASREVDALLVVVVSTAVTDAARVVALVDREADQAHLPVLLVQVGDRSVGASHLTRFRSADAAVRALSHAARYSRWRSVADVEVALRADAVSADEVTTADRPTGGSWLTVPESERLLSNYGIRSAPYAVVRSAGDIREATRRLGCPLVLKTADPQVVHKTELGLVHVGLDDLDQVQEAARAARAGIGDPDAPLVLQVQLSGPEIAVGVVRDPSFGPLVMLASGGTSLDLWDDQVFAMPPVSRDDARSALESLRTWPLVTGFRGSSALDEEAVVDLVLAVGRMALERPDLAEIDLNPVLVTAEGPVCVDAKVRRYDAQDG